MVEESGIDSGETSTPRSMNSGKYSKAAKLSPAGSETAPSGVPHNVTSA